jgi:hypothetical protein
MIDYKYPTIASGATPIGSADRAPDEELLHEDNEWRTRKKFFESIIRGKHQKHGLDIYSHRESGLCTRKIIQEPYDFGHCISQPRQVHILKDG